MRYVAPILVLAGFVVVPRWALAQVECPASTLSLASTCQISTTAAQFDTTCRPYSHNGVRVRGHFDLMADVLGLTVELPAYIGPESGQIRVADRYRLTGPPAGTPIPSPSDCRPSGRSPPARAPSATRHPRRPGPSNS